MKKMLKNKKFYIIISIIFSFTFILSGLALAGETNTEVNIPNPITGDNFEAVVGSILDSLQLFVGGIAIIMFVIAGMIYIFSGGNQERTELAKKVMTATIIGLVIILAGRTIFKEIYDIFGDVLGEEGNEISNSNKAIDIVENVLNFVLSLVVIIAIITLAIGGITYLTSGGNQERAESAKKQIIYSIIGITLALGSMVIVTQIVNLIEAS